MILHASRQEKSSVLIGGQAASWGSKLILVFELSG